MADHWDFIIKKILRENSTVRETEEMARKIKSEVEKKEPRTPKTKMYVPALEKAAEDLKKVLELDKVDFTQTQKSARMTVEIKGTPELTTAKIKEIVEKLGGSIQE